QLPFSPCCYWHSRVRLSMQHVRLSFPPGLPVLHLTVAALGVPDLRRRGGTIALWSVAAISFWLSLGFGGGLAEILWAIPPLRHFRYPSKFALPFALSLSVLAALASTGGRDGRNRRILAVLAGIGAVCLLGGGL